MTVLGAATNWSWSRNSVVGLFKLGDTRAHNEITAFLWRYSGVGKELFGGGGSVVRTGIA